MAENKQYITHIQENGTVMISEDVVANIVADVIILFSSQVRAFMKNGAKFIASGIIDSRADEVCTALQNAGLVLKERIEENGWVCLVCE